MPSTSSVSVTDRQHAQSQKEKEAKSLKQQQQQDHQLEMRKGFFIKKKLNKVENWEKIEKANAVAKKADKSDKHQLDAIFESKRGIMFDVDKEVTSHMQNLAADYKSKRKIYEYIYPDLAHEMRVQEEEKTRSQSQPVKTTSEKSLIQNPDQQMPEGSHRSIQVFSVSKMRDFDKETTDHHDHLASPHHSMATHAQFSGSHFGRPTLLKTVSAVPPPDTDTNSSQGDRRSRASGRKSGKFQSESLVGIPAMDKAKTKFSGHSAALPLITQASTVLDEGRSKSELLKVQSRHEQVRLGWKQSALRTTAGPEMVHLRQVEERFSQVTTPSHKQMGGGDSKEGSVRPQLIILPANDGATPAMRSQLADGLTPQSSFGQRSQIASRLKSSSIDRFRR